MFVSKEAFPAAGRKEMATKELPEASLGRLRPHYRIGTDVVGSAAPVLYEGSGVIGPGLSVGGYAVKGLGVWLKALHKHKVPVCLIDIAILRLATERSGPSHPPPASQEPNIVFGVSPRPVQLRY